MSDPTGSAGRGRLAEVLATRGGRAEPEAPFVIEHREALIYMLCQAAELEHGIMCQYLFAAFSLWGTTSRFATGSGAVPAIASEEEPMHFDDDIKPLFRDRDRASMRYAFDLWAVDDVSTHADAILARLEAGTMPCDGAWPAERVAVFRRWIDAGKPA